MVGYCNYSSLLYHFRVIRHWIIRDLEIWVKGHSRSFKLVPLESLGAVSYSPSVATMVLSCIISEKKRDSRQKSRFFHIPLAFDALVREVPVRLLSLRLVQKN